MEIHRIPSRPTRVPAFLLLLAAAGLGCDGPDEPLVVGRTEARPEPGPATPAGAPPATDAGTPDPAAIYRRYCESCHGPDGDGDSINAEYLRRLDPGLAIPDLRRAGSGDPVWLERARRVVVGGGRAVPGGTAWMPAWGRTLGAGEISAVLRYVASLAGRPRTELVNLSTGTDRACAGCHHVGGEELVRQANCAGCHAIAGLERRAVAPDLAGVGRKFRPAFLFEFLRRPWNRRQPGFRPMEVVRMPNFQLSDEEALALAEYLRTRTALDLAGTWTRPDLAGRDLAEEGRRIVDRYGCLGCHKLGSEGGKIAPDLTWLSTGFWEPDWVYAWILDPRRYQPDSPMPVLGLTPEEARIVTAWLVEGRPSPANADRHGQERTGGLDPASVGFYPELGPGDRAAKAADGERLFRDLGCRGCHPLADEPDGAGPDRVGPSLDQAGVRLRRDWTYDYLADASIHRIRPGLAPARMPFVNLSRDEFASIIRWLEDRARERREDLALRHGSAPASHVPDPVAGRRLFVEKDCHSCHVVGEERFPPVTSHYFVGQQQRTRVRWAPDLALASRRLDRTWARAWLADPAAVDPAAQMPRIVSTPEEIESILDWLLGR